MISNSAFTWDSNTQTSAFLKRQLRTLTGAQDQAECEGNEKRSAMRIAMKGTTVIAIMIMSGIRVYTVSVVI